MHLRFVYLSLVCALLAATPTKAANMIANGGFETPVLPAGTNLDYTAPTPWIFGGGAALIRPDPSWIYYPYYPQTAASGAQYAVFGSNTAQMVYLPLAIPSGKALSSLRWSQAQHIELSFLNYTVRILRATDFSVAAEGSFDISASATPFAWLPRSFTLPAELIGPGNYYVEFHPTTSGFAPYMVDEVIVEVAPLPPPPPPTIDPNTPFAYSANTGWINFRPSDTEGASVGETFLAGYIHGANTGWIDLGRTPGNGYSYTNIAGDFGVNHDGAGRLSGLAYSANTGWINFDWASSNDPNRPRLDLDDGRLLGYVYGANIGWIHLGAAGLATLTVSRPDTDADGVADDWERENFGNLTTAAVGTDTDGDGESDAAEYIAGTDPQALSDYLHVGPQTYSEDLGSVTLQFVSNPTRRYRIEHTTSLTSTWVDSPLGAITPDAGTVTSRTFSFPSDGRSHFFRVVAVLPLTP